MAHIEETLDREVDVKQLARIANTSEYHLRRLFSAPSTSAELRPASSARRVLLTCAIKSTAAGNC